MSGMSLAALELAIRNWVKGKLPADWKAVWANQNAPKLPLEMTLRRGNPYIRKVGRDVHGKVSTSTGARPVLGTRELMLELRGYGLGARQIAEDLRTLLDDETTADALIALAITVVDTGPVRDMTELYDSQFKEVAGFELTLRTHSLRESADAESGVGYIQTVDLEVTTKDPAGAASVRTLHVTSP